MHAAEFFLCCPHRRLCPSVTILPFRTHCGRHQGSDDGLIKGLTKSMGTSRLSYWSPKAGVEANTPSGTLLRGSDSSSLGSNIMVYPLMDVHPPPLLLSKDFPSL